jgi:hypothetical protein
MSAAEKQDIQEKAKEETKSSPKDNVIKLEFTATQEVKEMGVPVVSNDEEGAEVHQLPTAANNVVPVVNQGAIDTLEAQVKLIALFSSEAKVLEAEMNKLIKGAYAKAPEAKPYFLKMKKLLQMHADIEKILEKAKTVK